MSKKETALQSKKLQGAAPAKEQEPAAQAAEAAVVDSVTDIAPEVETEATPKVEPEAAPEVESATTSEAKPINLVVLAYRGTEDLVRRLWEKFYGPEIKVISVDDADDLVHILEDAIAMPDVDKNFTVVPANLVPCAPVSWPELQVPRVDDRGNDMFTFWGRVPVCFDKDLLVDFLPAKDSLSAEQIARELTCLHTRPECVSHSYGNFYTKVLRATPCEAVVIEAMMRKRFIYASEAGWHAIADLLIQGLLK
ncbi:MAG: hypothetical protein K6E35_07805 [Bacteroidales bacterium]|nr:hypothetical protein [Bacteroidales bacterium]